MLETFRFLRIVISHSDRSEIKFAQLEKWSIFHQRTFSSFLHTRILYSSFQSTNSSVTVRRSLQDCFCRFITKLVRGVLRYKGFALASGHGSGIWHSRLDAGQGVVVSTLFRQAARNRADYVSAEMWSVLCTVRSIRKWIWLTYLAPWGTRG